MENMNKEEYFKLILERVKNPDFVTFTNDANDGEKRHLLGLLYSKINVFDEEEGRKQVPVSICERKYVHQTFKKLYKQAIKWAKEQGEKGLAAKVNSQPDLFQSQEFRRHLDALDGGYWYQRAGYPPYFKN